MMSAQAIVLIPGLKGTKLVNTNRASHDVIWSGLQSEFETIEDLELTEPLDGEFYDQEAKVIIRAGEIESMAYGEFLRDLRTDKPVYIFHYDWRMAAVENGERLARFLDYLIAKSHAAKWDKPIERFDIVTHSLGNFVLRAFLHDYTADLVNKVVFTVPPFKGSLEILLGVLVGQGFFGWTKSKTRKLLRTLPGALELLPTYSGAAVFRGDDSEVNLFNVNHWQQNITDTRVSSAGKKSLAQKFRKTLAVAADSVDNHLQDLSALPKAVRERMLVIARDGYDTLQSVEVIRNSPGQPRNLVDFDGARRNKLGDGTVPHASSCCYFDKIDTLMVTDSWFHREYGHAFILNDDRVQRLISRFLSDKELDHRSPGESVKRVVGLRPFHGRRMEGWEAVW